MNGRAHIVVALQADLAADAHLVRSAVAATGVVRWLYCGEDSAWRVAAQTGALAGIPRILVGERFERLARELRQPYIDWIGRLSELNDSPEWWASTLAGKVPQNLLYPRLVALAAALEVIEEIREEPTLLVCSSPALAREVEAAAAAREVRTSRLRVGSAGPGWRLRAARALSAAASRAPSAVRLLPPALHGKVWPLLAESPAFRGEVLRSRGARQLSDFAGPETVLFATWADARSFTETGAYADPFFGPLPGELEARGYRVAFLPWLLPSSPFGETAERLARSGARVAFGELALDNADERACARAAREFRPSIPPGSTVGGVPAAALAAEHVEEYRAAQAAALTYEPVVRGLAAAGVRPSLLVHLFEGHTWEQTLAHAVRRHMPGTRIVGYDNGVFAELMLCLFPAASEYGLRPLPDRIVTSGRLFHDLLREEGVPGELVRVGCALRFAPRSPADAPGRSDGPVRVLVAGSIDVADSVDLLEPAVRAFAGDAAYRVVVKPHPVQDPAVLREVAERLGVGSNVTFTNAPMTELLETADLLLYRYTTVSWDALARGVPPVFVKGENTLDLDPLERRPEVRWTARTADELRAAAARIASLDEDERRAWRERADAAVAEAFRPFGAGCVDAFVE